MENEAAVVIKSILTNTKKRMSFVDQLIARANILQAIQDAAKINPILSGKRILTVH